MSDEANPYRPPTTETLAPASGDPEALLATLRSRRGCRALAAYLLLGGPFAFLELGGLWLVEAGALVLLALLTYGAWYLTAAARPRPRAVGRALALGHVALQAPALYLTYSSLLLRDTSRSATRALLEEGLLLVDRALAVALFVTVALVLGNLLGRAGRPRLARWAKVLVGLTLLSGTYRLATTSYRGWLLIARDLRRTAFDAYRRGRELLDRLKLYVGAPLNLVTLVLQLVLLFTCARSLRPGLPPTDRRDPSATAAD